MLIVGWTIENLMKKNPAKRPIQSPNSIVCTNWSCGEHGDPAALELHQRTNLEGARHLIEATTRIPLQNGRARNWSSFRAVTIK